MKTEMMSLNKIKPYWRNPRFNKESINVVKKSIQKFGFINPILIDSDNVIITGHSRYKALMELDYTEAEVIKIDISKSKAKEYRIIDNKVAEYSNWDLSKLITEIKNIDLELLNDFFDTSQLTSWITDRTNITTPEYSEDDDIEFLDLSDKPSKEDLTAHLKPVVDHGPKYIEDRPKITIEDDEEALFDIHCPHCYEENLYNLEELKSYINKKR